MIPVTPGAPGGRVYLSVDAEDPGDAGAASAEDTAMRLARTPEPHAPQATWLRALALVAALVFGAMSSAPAFAADEEPESCLDCHAANATKTGAPAGKRVDAEAFRASLHRKSCVQCHEDMEEVPHPKGARPSKVDCATCHEDSQTKFLATPHGKIAADASDKGPTCATCHPPHAIVAAKDPASSVHKTNLLETCGQCHGGDRAAGGRTPRTAADYAKSVHGVELLQKHNEKAPGCTDCHPIHTMRRDLDPASKTFKPNIPALCGGCHAEIAAEYRGSIHGEALAKGKMDSPACNDCHSEHSIARKEAPDSSVFAGHVSLTCSGCHAAERITRRYGLATDRVATYRDSYHGLADLGGSSAAANCASCHGFHDVRPSTDPKSRIHRDNLLATCRQCHQGAAAGFIEGKVHATSDPVDERAAWWVGTIYLWLIPATIGGMLLHNAVIFLRYVGDKRRAQKASTTYVRFRPFEIAVHSSVAASFIVLAITGFALAFPEAAWVKGLAAAGMDEAVRGWVHRAAAVVFSVASVAHIVYVVATRHGRYAFGRILPRMQDLRDARQNMLWHLRLTDVRPRFDRFDYTMKVEYWALAWGSLVMGVTGGLLWFKEEVSAWVPRWIVFVGERVHYYEAILAVLAIVVWHFFFVIFHPAEYPMNLTWLTGRKTAHEMEEAHPVEYERLKDAPEYRKPPETGPGAPDADPHRGTSPDEGPRA